MNDHVRQLGAESEIKYAAYDILHKAFRFNNLLRTKYFYQRIQGLIWNSRKKIHFQSAIYDFQLFCILY